MTKGKLYGIGLGPGDPDLITLKAHRVITSVPVIAVPKSANNRSYALSIAQHLIDETKQEIIYIEFEMTRDGETRPPHFKPTGRLLMDRLYQGKDVAFLTEGDPFLFSTFISLYEMVKSEYPDVEINIVPGISSVTASAIAARTPLAIGGERVAILPAVYEIGKLREVISSFDSIVLMKINSVLPEVLDLLDEMDLARSAFLVEKCGTAEQRVFLNVGELRDKKVHYFSTLIIKKRPRVS